MKKIAYLLIAAMSLVSVASCVKELTPDPALECSVTGQVFTVSLPADTRTSFIMDRKTVWAEGDSLWVSNGQYSETIVVPETAWGRKAFDFTTTVVKDTLQGSHVFVVYPYSVAAGVSNDKVNIKIPIAQDGQFETANIMAAVSKDFKVTMRNVTSLLKITVPEETSAPIFQLFVAAANNNPLTGTCSVDLSGDSPVVTPTAPSSSASIQVDGFAGEFYVSVIPGTFDPGFKVTAATADFQYASETKETTVANTVAVNSIVNLGEIGTNLQPLEGEGTASSPWLIQSLGHLIAVASAVDEGNTFEGGSFKVMNDISGIGTPIGSSGEEVHPFCGEFDGSDHVLTLDMTGVHNTGLFGLVGSKANIHNVKLAGAVNATGNSAAALVGQIYAAGEDPIVIKDVVNDASVKGARSVGGIVGYSTGGGASITLENCINNGAINGTNRVGGIAGEMLATSTPKTIKNCSNTGAVGGNACAAGIVGYYVNAIASGGTALAGDDRVINTLSGCSNAGSVTTTSNNGSAWYQFWGKNASNANTRYVRSWNSTAENGTGGIVGYAQQTAIDNCNNSGEIKAINKAGGIAGFLCHADVDNCFNQGNVSVTAYQVTSNQATMYEGEAGGIAGGSFASSSLKNCENTASIYGYASIGGIIGFAVGSDASAGMGTAISYTIENCVNRGEVVAKNAAAGGIAGTTYALNNTNTVSVIKAHNYGAVTSQTNKAGGIVGEMVDVTGWSRPNVQKSVNDGAVTAKIWAGGIVGYGGTASNLHNPNGSGVGYATHRFWIANCQNNGTVTGTRSDADNGEVVGGIIGTCFFATNADTREYMGIELYNCLNTGDVLYTEATHKNVYVGGVVGRFGRGCLYNAANTGRVGLASGTPADGVNAKLGAIVGNVEATANRITKLSGCYYLEGTADLPYGSASVVNHPDPVDVISYSSEGSLATPSSGGASFVDEALNAWVETRTGYYPWTFGTKLELVFE